MKPFVSRFYKRPHIGAVRENFRIASGLLQGGSRSCDCPWTGFELISESVHGAEEGVSLGGLLGAIGGSIAPGHGWGRSTHQDWTSISGFAAAAQDSHPASRSPIRSAGLNRSWARAAFSAS